MIVGTGDDVLLVYLLCPPTQNRHAVFDRADAKLLLQPILDQGIDMLRFKRAGIHAAKSQCNQLVRDEHQLMQAIGLGCVTAIAVAITELFKLVVQISHSAISFR